ncbi:hypothetical protein AVEN_37805-1 [Araneus ventricosus]|uniref:Uncharacterized protein n=1 Tax=Araneus ventricosus TaxID=182803 RepID=A0A4Y2G6M3_ARAVE|nr:hypothetical protein AVEN_37805-1 [Araneus ventricosus]
MTRTTPEMAPPSPNFRATPTGGRLATTYDLVCNRPHTRRIFGGIGFRTCDPPVPRNNVLLYWIKAHKGQWGKERGDFLAKSATEKDLIKGQWDNERGDFLAKSATEKDLIKGQWGNERGDFLAKSATEKDLIDVAFLQSARQLRNASNQNIKEYWQARWSDSRKGIGTKRFYEKVDTKRICGDFCFNQVLTGHGVFGSFQAS